MNYDEYRRLHLACLDMARQTSLPDVRARWLAIADAWLKVAIDLRDVIEVLPEGHHETTTNIAVFTKPASLWPSRPRE